MTDDPRCCGSGTCIINAAGQCWCGQQWDGQRMCAAPLPAAVTSRPDAQAAAARAPVGDVPDPQESPTATR